MYNKPSPVEQLIHLLADSFQAMEGAIARAKVSSKVDKIVDAKPALLHKCKANFLHIRMLILDIDLQILRFKNQLRDVPLSDQEDVSFIQTEIALLQSLATEAHVKKRKYASELSQALDAEIETIQQKIGDGENELLSYCSAVEQERLKNSTRQAKLKILELQELKDKWLG